MGFLKPSTTEKSKPDAQAVGSDLLAVLPEIPTPWYRTKHLLLLNLILLIPVLSSAAVGFDGLLICHHAGGDESSALVDYEIRQIKENIRLKTEAAKESSYPVSYYVNLVLNIVGITATKDQGLINGLLQLFNWIAAVFAGVMMTILTSVFSRTKDERASYAVAAFIFIYYFFHDIAWTPLLMAYPVEIFPFCNPIGLATLGWKYYIVFCILLTLLLFLIWLPFPETKGRTLQQIAEIFDGKNHRLGACGIGEGKADDAKVQEVEDYADTEA
ncbi:lactose permease [Colletotrichum graminicola M1.001]|uniref:Lactose permease n=1 Tax=Colletotrichum graminicola (strain M1.001 / M2 / FGSC 10212) TaxID=645133 RepID=E3Q8K1_COLGM|nr:lactose permease [Colletotrichum graminicola M1.001]EFQ26872.1 lactose permease [Colletotrichum graminicola M1.001]